VRLDTPEAGTVRGKIRVVSIARMRTARGTVEPAVVPACSRGSNRGARSHGGLDGAFATHTRIGDDAAPSALAVRQQSNHVMRAYSRVVFAFGSRSH